MLHINVPSSGYDSSDKAVRVPVTLLCTSAACRNGVVNNGFLLAAYDSDGTAVGTFDTLPAGAMRLRVIGSAEACPRVAHPKRAPKAALTPPAARQARSARAGTP